MAVPLTFKPQPHDPRKELEARLAAAPRDHAEALLVLWDLLAVSHRHGVLDALVGLAGSKNAIAGQIAVFAKEPAATQAIRNMLTLGQALGSIDPDVLASIVKALTPPPTVDATSEEQVAREQSDNPVLGFGLKEDSTRRAEYKMRGRNADPARALTMHGASENSSASPTAEEVAAFDLSAEPPSLWQLARRFMSKDARRAMAAGANTLTTIGRVMKR